jgi:hypothetical protein
VVVVVDDDDDDVDVIVHKVPFMLPYPDIQGKAEMRTILPRDNDGGHCIIKDTFIHTINYKSVYCFMNAY